MTKPILPGATLGVLGSGQLGRMFAIAARRLGYHVHVFSPDCDTPCGQVADVEYAAPYEDYARLTQFARGVDVVTFEFENVPSAITELIGQSTLVRPAGTVLNIAQHRLREKTTLRQSGLPVPGFEAIRSAADLESALLKLGRPAVLKTASSGYDGKGQVKIVADTVAADAWASLQTDEAILEAFVDFACEISIVGARNPQGDFAYYGPFRNLHANHILDVSLSPSGLGPLIEARAVELTRTVFESLNVVGVLCVEMFVTHSSDILINELAPRPHNSGHLTIDAHTTCQFEQQVRAICGLPLGDTTQRRPAAMANLLGDLWDQGTPAWSQLLAMSDVKLHLYGKAEPRPGRKMGHLTAVRDTLADAEAAVRKARDVLARVSRDE